MTGHCQQKHCECNPTRTPKTMGVSPAAKCVRDSVRASSGTRASSGGRAASLDEQRAESKERHGRKDEMVMASTGQASNCVADKVGRRKARGAVSTELSLSDLAVSMDFEDEVLEFQGWTLSLDASSSEYSIRR